MEFNQKDFVVSIKNLDCPILITVPHGGMPRRYGSWLNYFFEKRPEDDNHITKGDAYIWHVVADILKKYPANAVVGLIPRCYIDYNRFDDTAYSDRNLKLFYEAYHDAICEIIKKLSKKWGRIVLLDFHGFSKQPIARKNFDIILGTNDGESSLSGIDKIIYRSMKDKYKIFCSGQDRLPRESVYRGDTTNLYYHNKYNLDGVLVEISPRFRKKTSESKRAGIELAYDFSTVFKVIAQKVSKI
jgi:N-formylglutamate amidohydrolase